MAAADTRVGTQLQVSLRTFVDLLVYAIKGTAIRKNSPYMRERREVYSIEIVITAPREWIEAVSKLCLSSRADGRLQALMDRNTEGRLTEDERKELATLAELSEQISLVRTTALQLLGRQLR